MLSWARGRAAVSRDFAPVFQIKRIPRAIIELVTTTASTSLISQSGLEGSMADYANTKDAIRLCEAVVRDAFGEVVCVSLAFASAMNHPPLPRRRNDWRAMTRLYSLSLGNRRGG